MKAPGPALLPDPASLPPMHPDRSLPMSRIPANVPGALGVPR